MKKSTILCLSTLLLLTACSHNPSPAERIANELYHKFLTDPTYSEMEMKSLVMSLDAKAQQNVGMTLQEVYVGCVTKYTAGYSKQDLTNIADIMAKSRDPDYKGNEADNVYSMPMLTIMTQAVNCMEATLSR